jgi:hypothetical protein
MGRRSAKGAVQERKPRAQGLRLRPPGTGTGQGRVGGRPTHCFSHTFSLSPGRFEEEEEGAPQSRLPRGGCIVIEIQLRPCQWRGRRGRIRIGGRHKCTVREGHSDTSLAPRFRGQKQQMRLNQAGQFGTWGGANSTDSALWLHSTTSPSLSRRP